MKKNLIFGTVLLLCVLGSLFYFFMPNAERVAEQKAIEDHAEVKAYYDEHAGKLTHEYRFMEEKHHLQTLNYLDTQLHQMELMIADSTYEAPEIPEVPKLITENDFIERELIYRFGLDKYSNYKRIKDALAEAHVDSLKSMEMIKDSLHAEYKKRLKNL